MKKLFSAIILVSIAFLCISCNTDNSSGSKETVSTAEQSSTVQPTTMSEEELAEKRIDNLISSMTVEEKVGQMFFVRYPDVNAEEQVLEYSLGGYILFGIRQGF